MPQWNLLVFCADTFRADHLDVYGDHSVDTPNLDRLARESIVFLDAFAEGLPTLPVRHVVFTGKTMFPLQLLDQPDDPVKLPGWHHLFKDDVTLANILTDAGYTTGLITDVHHMMKPGRNFHRGFKSWRFIRGQETDAYRTGPKEVDISGVLPPDTKNERLRRLVIQYLRNRRGWQTEEDYFAPQVMCTAAQWLEENATCEPFFLWVDCFDPHEPWDPPTYYADRYAPRPGKIEYICPDGNARQFSEDEMRRIRALYAGEVTLVDRWIGYVLEKLSLLGLSDRTLIVFLSDHGTMLGERGEIHKGPWRLRRQCTQVPLIIRHPEGEGAGRRVRGFVQHQDILPTLLHLLDIPVTEQVDGSNMWSLVDLGEDSPGLRDTIITAYAWYASVRSREWNYISSWKFPAEGDDLGFVQQGPQLYHLTEDPEELHNVINDYPEVARQMDDYLRSAIEAGNAKSRNQDNLWG